MTLEEAKEKINELFDNKIIDIRWNMPSDIANGLEENLNIARDWSMASIDELEGRGLTSEQIEEDINSIIKEAKETVSKEYEESPLDLTTSFDSAVSDDETPLLLNTVEQIIRSNINSRIFTIAQDAIGEEPTPILLNILDPGYLALNHPDVEIVAAITDEIKENFSQEISSIREQVNNLISLRNSLIAEANQVDEQGCIDITRTINQIVDPREDSDADKQRIKEILLKVANSNSGAIEQAILIGISENDITRLQAAAREYGQSRQDDLSGIIRRSTEEEITHPPLLIRHQEEFIDSFSQEDILQDLYQYIISQSESTPVTPIEEMATEYEDFTNQEHVFEGLYTLSYSTEEINTQIRLYLRQVLFGEEGQFDGEIVSYVTNIVGAIDDPDSRLGQAHLRIQESLDRLSQEYDEFDLGYQQIPAEDNNSLFDEMLEEGSDNNQEIESERLLRTPDSNDIDEGEVLYPEVVMRFVSDTTNATATSQTRTPELLISGDMDDFGYNGHRVNFDDANSS